MYFLKRESESCSGMSDSATPRTIVRAILQDRIMEWGAFSFSGNLTDPVIELGSPALQADSLSTELSGRYLKCFFLIPYEDKLKAIFLRIWLKIALNSFFFLEKFMRDAVMFSIIHHNC